MAKEEKTKNWQKRKRQKTGKRGKDKKLAKEEKEKTGKKEKKKSGHKITEESLPPPSPLKICILINSSFVFLHFAFPPLWSHFENTSK